MASSDSEEFASADEAVSTDGHDRRRRSKRNSSSNYDSEDGAAGKPTVTPMQSAAELTKETPTLAPIPVKKTDGWDDFDIEEEPAEGNQSCSEPTPAAVSTTVTAVSTTVTAVSTTVTAVTSLETTATTTVKEPALVDAVSEFAGSAVKNVCAGDGWDQFDDWAQDNSEKTVTVPKPLSQPQEEDKIKSVADRLSGLSTGAQESAWGWGSWGVDTLLSTASAGITTLTSTVSQGLSTVSNALESGIGAPEPEVLARRNLDTIEEKSETTPPGSAGAADAQTANEGSFAFGNLMSGVSHITKFVENTGSKVITGGLDTLETIGKKTMEVLQEGDPGLARKRALLLGGGGPALSTLLREAKTQAEVEDRARDERREAKLVHYETLFDDFEGLVHLEALEMLSRQVSARLEERVRSAGDKRRELKETLQQVAELCEMADEEEEEREGEPAGGGGGGLDAEALREELREATQDLGVELTFQPLLEQTEELASWRCAEGGGGGGGEAFERAAYKAAVGGLARGTALAVQLYHKAAEMLLVRPRRSTADEADALTQMTSVLKRHVARIASHFAERLGRLSGEGNRDQVNTYITNVFLEAGNSSSYIQNAFQLTLPILQIGAA